MSSQPPSSKLVDTGSPDEERLSTEEEGRQPEKSSPNVPPPPEEEGHPDPLSTESDELFEEHANDAEQEPEGGKETTSDGDKSQRFSSVDTVRHRNSNMGSLLRSRNKTPIVERKTVALVLGSSFMARMKRDGTHRHVYGDYYEEKQLVKEAKDKYSNNQRSKIEIPTLRECLKYFSNKEATEARHRNSSMHYRHANTILDIVAAFYMYIAYTLGFETVLVVANAVLVTWYYCHYAQEYATKLDFAFLSFAVVFPLTFLINSTFSRRDLALTRLADFKASVLATTLFTLTTDWPDREGNPTGGRLDLPSHFDAEVVEDFRVLLQLVYEYLSMPRVDHARHVTFPRKQTYKLRVHAIQNDIIKKVNDTMFDFAMHTELMRKHGFPSGEASRLHQYHQYLQQRFEQLRIIKYYRTPQATRSFGRVYIFVLPWLMGPYYAWVYLSTNYAYTLALAGFTFVVLLGLLNTQQGLEDPFLTDYASWTPGIDTIKLGFEMAVTLQAIEQYVAEAQLRRSWELRERQHKEKTRTTTDPN